MPGKKRAADESAEEGEEGCDAAPLEEVPYAAANLMIPPGGENPVSNMDQMLQVSESLMQPGGQRALEEAVAGEGDEGGARGSLSPRKG